MRGEDPIEDLDLEDAACTVADDALHGAAAGDLPRDGERNRLDASVDVRGTRSRVEIIGRHRDDERRRRTADGRELSRSGRDRQDHGERVVVLHRSRAVVRVIG
ncbi:hypothetical protein ABC304_05495 [Microbacterium sp. 1P10UB]